MTPGTLIALLAAGAAASPMSPAARADLALLEERLSAGTLPPATGEEAQQVADLLAGRRLAGHGPDLATSLAQLRTSQDQVAMTTGGKCDKDCKQDKKISELKGNFQAGTILWDKLMNATEQINKRLDTNEKSLNNKTSELALAVKNSDTYYEEVDKDLSKMLRQRHSESTKNTAMAQIPVDESFQAVQSFYNYIKPKFGEMRDTIEQNKYEVKAYLKGLVQQSQRDQAVLNKNVAKMKTRLEDNLGQTKTALESKLDTKIKIMDIKLDTVGKALENAKNRITASYEPGPDGDNFALVNKKITDLGKTLKLYTATANVNAQKASQTADHKLTQRIGQLEDSNAEINEEAQGNLQLLYEALVDAAKEAGQHAMTIQNENSVAMENEGAQIESESTQYGKDSKTKFQSFLKFLKENDLDTTEVMGMLREWTVEGQQVIDSLKSQEKTTGELGKAAYNQLNTKWTTDFTNLESEEVEREKTLADKIKTDLSAASALDKDGMMNLAHNLEKLEETSSLDLDSLSNDLEAIQGITFDTFEHQGSVFDQMGDDFADLGNVMELSSAERAMALGQEVTKIEAGGAKSKKSAAQMTAALLEGFGEASAEIGQEQKDAEAAFMTGNADMLEKFRIYADGMNAKTDRELTAVEGSVGSLISKFGLEQDMQTAGERKAMAETLRLNNELAGLEAGQSGSASAIDRAAESADDGVAAARVALKAKLSQKLFSANDQVAKGLSRADALAKAEISAAATKVGDKVTGEGEELSMLEKLMQEGADGFETKAQRAQANVRSLRVAAAHVNSMIEAEFDKARKMLKESQLSADMSKESLQELLDTRTKAIEDLGKSQLKVLDENQNAAFNAAKEKRSAAIKQIMEDETLSMAEKIEKIQKAENEMVAELNKLEEDAHISQEEVDAIHKQQQDTILKVEAAMEGAHSTLKMTDLLNAESTAAQKQMLQERSEKALLAIEAAVGNMDEKLKADIRDVQNEANDKIHGILQSCGPEGCTEAKLAQIEAIELAMKRACSDLAAKQVARDNQLHNFECAEAGWGKAVENQLGMLKGVLTDSQTSWLKGVLEQKHVMTQQTDELSTTVDSLLGLVDTESKASGEDLALVRLQTKQALQKIKLDLAATAEKHERAADEAMDLAKLAEAQAAGQQTGVGEAVGVAEQELQGYGDTAHKADEDMTENLVDERTARQKAVDHERKEAVDETGSLVEQIKAVSVNMARRSGKTSDKQRLLTHKLDTIAEILVAEAEKTQADTKAKLAGVAAGEEDVKRMAQFALDKETKFSHKFGSHESTMVGKLAALEEDAEVIATSGIDAVERSSSAGSGAISREKRAAQQEVRKTENEGSAEIAGELNNTEGYMQNTAHIIKEGIENEQRAVDLLTNESNAETAEKLRADAANHAALTQLGGRVGNMERRLSHATNAVKGKLASYEEKSEMEAEAAQEAVDDLQRKVDSMSLAEARRAEHRDAPISLLERREAEQEAATDAFVAKNERMKARLEAMVQAELRRQAIQA